MATTNNNGGWYFAENMFAELNDSPLVPNGRSLTNNSPQMNEVMTPGAAHHVGSSSGLQTPMSSSFLMDNQQDECCDDVSHNNDYHLASFDEGISTNQSHGKSAKEKKKPKIACVYCNKLHKKCDGESPNACTRCKKKGIPCVYLPPQKRGPKSKKRKADDDEEYEQMSCAQGLCATQTQQIQQIQQQQQQQFQSMPFSNQPTQPQITQTVTLTQPPQPQPPQQKIINNVDLESYIQDLANQSSASTQLQTYTPPQPTNYSSPLTGLQFAVNIHTRTLVDQFLDSVTCHSLVDRTLLDNALNKAVLFSSEPTGAQLLINIVCAMGAQRLEDRKNCVEFFNRARSQASYLFDIPSRETSCALSLMGIYACSEGERIKGNMYNRIALDMCDELCSNQIDTDKYYQSLLHLSFLTTLSKWLFELNILKVEEDSIDIIVKHGATSSHPEVPAIRETIKNIRSYLSSQKTVRQIEELETKINDQSLVKGSEEVAFAAILVYYLMASKIAAVDNSQVEFISILRKLEILEKYIESDKFVRDDVLKNVQRFCLYTLRSDILARCGLDKMGLHCATKATGLAAKPTFWKSAPNIILFFPLLAKVNLAINDSSMSVENYKSLKVLSSKFVVLKYTLFDMINVMNKKPQFRDLLESERQYPQAFPQSHDSTSHENTPQQVDWEMFENTQDVLAANINSDLNDLIQQLGTSQDHGDYQKKLDNIWQTLNSHSEL